jgi:1-acyl-sn-glycerol-3-phosphate acyltransferase
MTKHFQSLTDIYRLKKSETEFIPAQESRWFIFLFDLYMRSLFWRRFQNIWIDQNYHPSKTSRTIYYLNHTSWWDGLIPLLLNRKLFRQNARAMMEDKQMREHGLFKRIGAFSVNLENPRSAVRSLRYAVESMKRPHSSLFIYPEGKIVPFSIEKPDFKKGLGWIVSQCPDVDVVPIGIYIDHSKSDKPELFMKIGTVLKFESSDESDTLNHFFENKLSDLLSELIENAFHGRDQFQKL